MHPKIPMETDQQCDGPVSGLLQPVLEEYAQALEIPIHAHTPSNRLSPPRRGGGLHLHIFALPARPRRFILQPVTPTLEMPAVLPWAVADGRRRALAPGTAFVQGRLTHDPQGRAIAGILGENIYLLFDLFGQPEPLVGLVLRRTFDLCLPLLSEWLSLYTGRLPHQVRVTLSRLRHRTTLLTLDYGGPGTQGADPSDPRYREVTPEDRAGPVQEKMVVIEENLKELSRQMASHTRLLGSCHDRIRTLKEAEQSGEALLREIEGLFGIPEVRDVEVLGDRLSLVTDTVDTVVGGKRYRLGRFRLDIRFTGEVTIKNLTRPYGYYDHPHVWNARPCLGNIGHSVVKLVSEFQWVAAAQLLIEYLKTVNPKEWYTPIDHWEEAWA